MAANKQPLKVIPQNNGQASDSTTNNQARKDPPATTDGATGPSRTTGQENINPQQNNGQATDSTTNQAGPSRTIGRENINPQRQWGNARARGNVRNIDAPDIGRIQYAPEYAEDIFTYAFGEEYKLVSPPGFLEDNPRISTRHRSIIVNRLVEIADKFRCSSDVIFYTISYLDQYLHKTPDAMRSRLHAIGVTALWLANKVEEVYPIPMSDLVFITDNEATVPLMKSLEIDYLKKLGGKVTPVHQLMFLRRFSKAAAVAPRAHHMAKYITELAFTEILFCHTLPSKLAASALYLTNRLLNRPMGWWDATMEYYSRYRESDLFETAEALLGILRRARTNEFSAVYRKYSSQRLFTIALQPEVSPNRLQNFRLRPAGF